MRFKTSPEWQQAKTAHAAAYAAHDKHASAGDDHSPEAEAASDAEYAALDALMTTRGTTPHDIIGKLRMMNERDMWGWDGPRGLPRRESFIDTLFADLELMARPAPSTEMDTAFTAWAAAWQTLEDAEYDAEDQLPQGYRDAEAAAYRTVIDRPCITPGDFIVKAYISLLGKEGASNGGCPFLIKDWSLDDEEEDRSRDRIEAKRQLQDLSDCDLGQCMLALGRIDFDAAEWIKHALNIGHRFNVHRDGDKRGFSQSMVALDDVPAGDHRHPHLDLLMRLLNGGTGNERMVAVIDLVEAHHPTLVYDTAAIRAACDADEATAA